MFIILAVSLMPNNAYATTKLVGLIPIPGYSTYLDYKEDNIRQDGFDHWIKLNLSINKDNNNRKIYDLFTQEYQKLTPRSDVEYNKLYLSEHKPINALVPSVCWKESSYDLNASGKVKENISYNCNKYETVIKEIYRELDPNGIMDFKANRIYTVTWLTHLKHQIGSQIIDVVPVVLGEQLEEYALAITDCTRYKNITHTNSYENFTMELMEDSYWSGGVNITGLTFNSANASTEVVLTDATNKTIPKKTISTDHATYIEIVYNKNQTGGSSHNPESNYTLYYDCTTSVGTETEITYADEDFEGYVDKTDLVASGLMTVSAGAFGAFSNTTDVGGVNESLCEWCGASVMHLNASADNARIQIAIPTTNEPQFTRYTYKPKGDHAFIGMEVEAGGLSFRAPYNERTSLEYYCGSYVDTGLDVPINTWNNITFNTNSYGTGNVDVYVNEVARHDVCFWNTAASYSKIYFLSGLATDTRVYIIDNLLSGDGRSMNKTHKSTVTIGGEFVEVQPIISANATLWINGTNNDQTISYSETTNITGTFNFTDGGLSTALKFNGTATANPDIGIFGVGALNVSFEVSGNASVTGDLDWKILDVGEIPGNISTFTNITSFTGIKSEAEGVLSYCYNSSESGNITMIRNGTTQTNNTGYTPTAAGAFNFTCLGGYQNYTNVSTWALVNYDFVSLIVKTFEERTLNRINFNITITNSTASFNEENVVEILRELNSTFPLGSVTTEIEGNTSGYISRLYFHTLNPYSTVTLNAYLLETGDSNFASFGVINSWDVPMADVTISALRSINDTYVVVAQEITDDSGLAALYLDPTYTYQMMFVKDGYVTQYRDIKPNQETTYWITLGSSYEINFTTLFDDISYSFEPYETGLDNSDGETDFTFIIISGDGTLEWFKFNITYWNGTELYSNLVSGSPSGGTITATINLRDFESNLTVYGHFKKDGYVLKTLSKTYIIWNVTTGDYSIQGIIDDTKKGGFGLTEYMKAMIGIIFLALIVGGVATQAGAEGGGFVGIIGLVILGYANILHWGLIIVVGVSIVGVLILKWRG